MNYVASWCWTWSSLQGVWAKWLDRCISIFLCPHGFPTVSNIFWSNRNISFPGDLDCRWFWSVSNFWGPNKMDLQWVSPTSKHVFFSWCFPVEWGEVKGYPLPRTAERYSVSSILAAAFVENGAMTNLNRVNIEDVFRFVLSAVHHFHHRYQYGARLATRHLQSVNYFRFFGVCCQVVLACCYFLMYSYDILNWIADISYSVFNEGQQMMVMLVGFLYLYMCIYIYLSSKTQTELFNWIGWFFLGVFPANLEFDPHLIL